ncbi:unnamed protein product, partial [Mesorhabditis spiculigera]
MIAGSQGKRAHGLYPTANKEADWHHGSPIPQMVASVTILKSYMGFKKEKKTQMMEHLVHFRCSGNLVKGRFVRRTSFLQNASFTPITPPLQRLVARVCFVTKER